MRAKTWCVGWMALATLAGCGKSDDNQPAATNPATAPTQPAPAAVDPLPYAPPTTRPAFRHVLSTDQWQQQFQHALEQLPPVADLDKLKEPLVGVKITQVTPASQAAKLGIKVGDVMVALDGEQLYRPAQTRGLRTDGPQTLTVVSADGQERKLTIQPGEIGVDSEPHWNPLLLHIRGSNRSEKWDDYVLVAIANIEKDPELAETAWHYALAAGYRPDHLSDAHGAQLAQTLGRAKEALDFAHFARSEPAPQDISLLSPQDIFQAAIAEFKLEQALAAIRDGAADTENLETHFQRLLAKHTQLPTEQRVGLSPSQRAQSLRREDLLPRCAAMNDNTPWYLDRLVKGQDFEMKTPIEHYNGIVFAPSNAGRDMELVVHFVLPDLKVQPSRYARVFAVGLFDCNDPQPARLVESGMPGGFLGISIEDDGAAELFHGPGLTLTSIDVSREIANNREATLRIVQCAGRQEVFLNDRRLLYLPAANEPEITGVYIKTVGLTANVTAAQFSKLLPTP